MKGIFTQIKKQREKLVALALKRDEYFSKKSEKWQGGTSGALYEHKTEEITQVIIKLDTAITEFKNLLNDC